MTVKLRNEGRKQFVLLGDQVLDGDPLHLAGAMQNTLTLYSGEHRLIMSAPTQQEKLIWVKYFI